MTRFTPLESWFERLCVLSEPSQQTALEEIPDDGMRKQLEALLEADRVASRILDTSLEGGPSALLAADLARDTLPERIGAFRIVSRLGAGAMGSVYEAEQDHPRRRVAIKQLHPWLHSSLALKLFRFEAQALGQVQHPSIPVVYEAGEVDGAAYLSMELVQGRPLLEWVHASGATLDQRVQLLAQVARAVHAAHQAGLVHRDLKPANILVDDDGAPTLLDFGVAAPLRSREAGVRAGTPAYMSPEQAAGREVGPGSDIHALGTIGYQLLTGVLPVEGRDPEAVLARKNTLPTPAHQVAPAIDVDVGRAIQRALAVAPGARQASAEDFAEDLERALVGLPLDWVDGGWGYRVGRFSKRHRRSLLRGMGAAGIVALLLGAGVGALQAREGRADAAARSQLQQLRASTRVLVESSRHAEAEELLRSFVDDPSHHRVDVPAQAWLHWAQLEESEEAKERALAEAWVAAQSAGMLDTVAEALAGRFRRQSRWSEVWRLQELMGDTARRRSGPALLEAAVGRRDYLAAMALEPRPIFTELSRATRLPVRAERAFWLDVDGGVPELFVILGGATEVHDLLGERLLGSIDQSGDVGWMTRDLYRVHGGLLWVSMQDEGGRMVAFSLDENGLKQVRQFTGLASGRMLDQAWIETPAGPRAMLALAYPNRSLRAVDPVRGTVAAPHPATDALQSDVMSLAAHDLDGDGVQELVVGMGSWEADEVRVLTQDENGFELLARAPTGTVVHVEVLEREDGNPVVFVSKADLEQNRALYPDGSPFGPPGGVYLFELRQGALQQVGHLPFPVQDASTSGPEKAAHRPVFGDFDGDGRLDMALTLQHFDLGTRDAMWLVTDLLGRPSSLVSAGMSALAAHDVDGDGDDELLVSDQDQTLWVFGTGDQAVPTWDTKLSTARLPDPPTMDPSVRTGWDRARQLVDIGLAREAAQALARLPALGGQPESLALASLVAAELVEKAGDPEQAGLLFGAALEHPTTRSRALQGQLRTRMASLDYANAAQVDSLDRPDWLDTVQEPVSVLDLDGWQVERVGVFAREQEGLRVASFNDHGVLLRRPVRLTGPVLGIDLELTIEGLELGAGLAVEVVGGDAPREALVAFWGQGGGGRVNVYRHCAGRAMEDVGREVFQSPTDLRLGVLRSTPEKKLRCIVATKDHTGLPVTDAAPLEGGTYWLQLRAHGVPDYEPPTALRAVIRKLQVTGLELLDAPLNPEQQARADLIDGSIPASIAPDEAAWLAIATSDERALRRALADLWSRGERAPLRWLLRRHGATVVPDLVELAGPGFAPLFLEAWLHPSDPANRTPPIEAELSRPPLAALPPDRPAGAKLRLLRAEILLDRGELARAGTLVETVLRDPPEEVELDAWLLRARLHRDDEARRRAVGNALSLDRSGRTRERLLRSELAPWVPADD